MRRRVECTWSIIAIAVQILTKNSHIRNPKTLRGFVFVRSLFLPLLQQFFRNGRYTQLLLIAKVIECTECLNTGVVFIAKGTFLLHNIQHIWCKHTGKMGFKKFFLKH